MSDKGSCFDCRHCGADPDGPYCAHPAVLKTNPWGSNLDVVRGALYIRDDVDDDRRLKPHFGLCGQDGVLFEPRLSPDEKAALARRMR